MQKQLFTVNRPRQRTLVAAGSGALLALCLLSSGCSSTSRQAENLKLVAEAWGTIQREYVDPSAASSSNLTFGAIAGMVEALGDTGHSSYLTPEMLKDLRRMERGEFKGVGIELQMKDGRVVVVAPVDGSPAERAGIKPGDVIVEVGGQNITDWPLAKVVQQISGRPGTKITLVVEESRTGQTRELTLARTSIRVRDVSWHRLPGTDIAHLRVASFDSGVTRDLRRALSQIKREGLEFLILDLRNNPGGLLDEAISTASQFLTSGNVLLSRNVKGEVETIPVEKGGLAADIPMCVLVNEGSASAAEIVAAALQDAGRARLIGQTTFGTGTVLQEFPLADGSSVLLAIQEWLTPAGRSFWHKGLNPDVRVALEEDVAPLFPVAERELTPTQLQAIKDRQLLAAIEAANNPQKITSTARTGVSQ